MTKSKLYTQEELLETFEAYCKDTKSKPFIVKDWVGKDAYCVERQKERPLTMEGFRVYAFRNKGCVKHYFDNTDNRYNDYSTICAHIKAVIRQDQIDGGMAGIYSVSITQRLNNLKESIEQTQIIQPLFPDVQKNDQHKQDTES